MFQVRTLVSFLSPEDATKHSESTSRDKRCSHLKPDLFLPWANTGCMEMLFEGATSSQQPTPIWWSGNPVICAVKRDYSPSVPAGVQRNSEWVVLPLLASPGPLLCHETKANTYNRVPNLLTWSATLLLLQPLQGPRHCTWETKRYPKSSPEIWRDTGFSYGLVWACADGLCVLHHQELFSCLEIMLPKHL